MLGLLGLVASLAGAAASRTLADEASATKPRGPTPPPAAAPRAAAGAAASSAAPAEAPAAAPTQRPARRPARAPNPAYNKVEDRPGLPRVLLIGDSISIGYTVAVQKLLHDDANVHRAPTNCGPTTRGLEQLDQWLGTGRWDVIHFNFGLHDLKYVDAQGNLSNTLENARPQVAVADYERNLEQLVARLKTTNAQLIFATTTPVPEGSAGRVPADAPLYNAAALRVMERHGVAIDDLYAFALPSLAEIQLPQNVHFSPSGSQKLAEAVAASIRGALPKRP